MRKLTIYFETENGRYSMTPGKGIMEPYPGDTIDKAIIEISEKYPKAIIKSIIFFEDKNI